MDICGSAVRGGRGRGDGRKVCGVKLCFQLRRTGWGKERDTDGPFDDVGD